MKRLALTILASLAAASALAQSPAGGMFLVATPQLRDPRFAETVVLLLNHGSEGAIGVVVNRPTWVEPEALFPDMGFSRRYRGVVYFGGPVARTSALFLVRDGDLAEGQPIVDDVHVTADVDEVRENLPARTDERVLRVYAGYAGWGPGQLEREISAGDWQVTPASGDLIFTPEPANLWREVHRAAPDMGIVGMPESVRDGVRRAETPDANPHSTKFLQAGLREQPRAAGFHYCGRCDSRNARNSLVSLQAGHSSPSASRLPIR